MFVGRYQQGDSFSIRIQLVDANDSSAYPIEQVRWKLINPSGQVIYRDLAAIKGTIGAFGITLRLTSFFSLEGRYAVWFQARMSTNLYRDFIRYFRVINGGVSGGGVHSQFYWARSEADYLVWSNENGETIAGRNPSLT